ncbi:MAG: tryptophan 7-halogenase [Gammaproteobacteria bacterium]|nr:tryptophan 7-halogenase [Gammaproteobacteria bacterium]
MSSTQGKPPENILIVGGGSAGWMCASVFLNTMGKAGSRITLIESPNIPSIGVGEGTTPLFKRFLNFVGISEEELIRHCKASYKLGIKFPGWTNSEEFPSYFHPFTSPGLTQFEDDFFSYCDRRRQRENLNTDPGDFFFNAALASLSKAPLGPPPCDAGKLEYAYHFDTALVADYLKQRCIDLGINYVSADVSEVVQNDQGDLSHVLTESGEKLTADFFVDCTGFRKLLIGKTLDEKILPYKPRLFNDSACVIRTAVSEDVEFPPYTESTALKCGWAWRIPIGSKISWGYVHSSDYTSKEDAEQELRSLIGEDAEGIDALYIKLETGRLAQHWKRNCVAIGLSQGFIEPLEATALALTQFSINRFATHFTRGGYSDAHRDFYNDIINEAFDRTIDYIQMHYKLNTREDSQYWIDCRENDNITDTMRAIINGWDSGGDFIEVLKEQVHRSSYAPYSWYCIMAGMGRFPENARQPTVRQTQHPYHELAIQHHDHYQYLQNVSAS